MMSPDVKRNKIKFVNSILMLFNNQRFVIVWNKYFCLLQLFPKLMISLNYSIWKQLSRFHQSAIKLYLHF